MSAYKITIDKENCIGDAICTALCDNFYMDTDGKARLRKESIEDGEYDSKHEKEIYCPTLDIKISST